MASNRETQSWPDEMVLDMESGRVQDFPFLMPVHDDDEAGLHGTTFVDLDNMVIRVIGASVDGGTDAN